MEVEINKIKPLREYIDDRREMIEQIFTTIEQPTLMKMIPDALKDKKIDDIKAECLVELLGMSRKRIIGVMEGKEVDSSSSESFEFSDSDSVEGISSSESSKKTKKPGVKMKIDNTVLKEKSTLKKTHSQKQMRDEKHKEKTVPVDPAKEVHQQSSLRGPTRDRGSINPETEDKGKTLLEILELEMRARAIKSLLRREEEKKKAHQEPIEIDEDDDDVIIIDDRVSGEVDLTKDDSGDEKPKAINDRKIESTKPPAIDEDAESLEEVLRSLDNSIARYKDLTDIDTTQAENQNELEKPNEIIDLEDSDNSTSNTGGGKSSNTTWMDRWLESKDVKRVVTTSKLLTSVKKKMKMTKKNKSVPKKISDKEEIYVEGSVGEYEQLSSCVNKNNLTSPSKSNSVSSNNFVQLDEVSKDKSDTKL